MRNVLLSLVVVVVLAAGGLGGTFATWSDSETSGNNTIVTGSLDLKVNGTDDKPWGEGVPKLIEEVCVVPCNLYGPYDAYVIIEGENTTVLHDIIIENIRQVEGINTTMTCFVAD